MPGTVKLEVIKGPITGQVFTFDAHDVFIFGRSPECHARLPEDDHTASRHHFVVEVNPPDAIIRDLASLNGTHVNGIKYGGREDSETPEEAERRGYLDVALKDHDEVRVGQTVFRVRVLVPVLCSGCSREISDSERKACEWVDDTYICPSCRFLQEATELIPAGPSEAAPSKVVAPQPQPLQCKECGKDVSREVSEGRRGDYVCKSCQAEAEEDPAAVLIRLLLAKHQHRDIGVREVVGYEIKKQLGVGGMGAVYLARRKKDGAEVALKVMLAKVAVDEYARQQFQREIEVTRSLHHANCVELYDHGCAGSVFYFALEYCAGGSLAGLMERRGGRLTLRDGQPLMLDALAGLSYAHEHGYVHRDLKPQNILLTDAGGGSAKVSDFGLAKNFNEAGLSGMTATGTASGTIVFMPREQLIHYKYVKPVSDVWSIAATFYEMLTGHLPRDFTPSQDPVAVVLGNPVVPMRKRDTTIPKKVASVIDCALDDETENRYQTAGDFRRELEGVL